MTIQTWELLSYVVTVVGLPLAIFVFLYEQRRERENEEEAVYQLLSDNYQDFLKVALGNPDLGDPRLDLGFAEEEAVAIARMVPQSRAFLRQEANESMLST